MGLCLGPKLESLALPGSSITEASLLALLPRLSSLRRLDLRGLDSLFMSGAFLSREEHRQQVGGDGVETGNKQSEQFKQEIFKKSLFFYGVIKM